MPTCENCKRDVPKLPLKPFCYPCRDRFRKYGDPNAGPPVLKKLANPPDSLNEQQHNVLIGLMLGDGHLYKKSNNSNVKLTITRSQEDFDYLKFQFEVFRNICSDKGISSYEYFDKRFNKIIYSCRLQSAMVPALTPYHSKWYIKNETSYTKIIPNDLELNAEIIANWICDDGALSLNKDNNRIYSRFCTNGFTKDEVNFLQNLLNERYNEYFSITETKKNQFIICGADSATRTMLEDIDLVFPTSMSRKIIWKDILAANLPKQISKNISQKEKSDKVIKFLSENNTFTFAELNERLELYITKDNSNPFKNILRNIQPYIDLGYIIKTVRPKGPDYVKGHIYTITPHGTLFFTHHSKTQ